MSLELSAAIEARGFDVSFEVAAGETVAVLGPNGAGKSSLLNVVAGLVRPDRGRASLESRVLFDIGDGRADRWLAPHRRGVSLLAQDALLFPHLSAVDNVAFGPRSRGVSRPESRRIADEWLQRVDAAELRDRRPAQLSGGQAQRIAVARALASDPALLLLDEPLAALDVAVAPALRRVLKEVLADRMAVIVTHDVFDAFTLADRVVVLEAGRVVDAGPTHELLQRPRTPFAAGLASLNLLTGTFSTTGVLTSGGRDLRVETPTSVVTGDAAGVSIRPALVEVGAQHPLGTEPDVTTFAALVTDVEPRGDLVRVRSAEIAADVVPARVAELDLAPGTRVWFSFRAADALAYPL